MKNTGANPPMLFALLFLVSFCCLGNIALDHRTDIDRIGAARANLVRDRHGGGRGRDLRRWGRAHYRRGVAQNYGIQNILWVAMSGVVMGVVVSVFLRETAPRKVGVAASRAVAATP